MAQELQSLDCEVHLYPRRWWREEENDKHDACFYVCGALARLELKIAYLGLVDLPVCVARGVCKMDLQRGQG